MDQLLQPHEAVAEFLALSVVESTYTPGLRVNVVLNGYAVTITDTGRGMQLRPDAGDVISHSERALTSVYPIAAATPEANDLLTRLVWGQRGSLGPALANRNCLTLRYRSRREGEEWTQLFRNGQRVGPPERVGPTTERGTTIEFTTRSPIDDQPVSALIDALNASVSTINISCHR